MKKTLIISMIFVFISSWICAQTEGTLTVTASTSETGGNYAPRNIVAIWIEDDQGDFVKTLLAYAATRKTHLNTWEASTTAAGSPFNTTDAISGATRTSHSTRICSWNGTDIDGMPVADGTYRVRMELTDKNNTGNFSTFTFTKGPDAETLNPPDVPSFASISIDWVPVMTFVQDEFLDEEYEAIPNPTTGKIRVYGENVTHIAVMNLAGKLISSGKTTDIDLSREANGIYFLKITTDRGVITKKVFKK